MRKLLGVLLVLGASLFAGACAVIDHSAPGARLERGARWTMLPIVNHTDVPQAGLRAEAITEGLLRARGVGSLARYPTALNPETLFEPSERRAQVDAQEWAKKQGIRYGLTGAVDEWRYKVGVDGEPAVGVALQVIDLQSGDVVWSAVGAKSGWSRESLAGVAQKLIRELLAGARID
jgi:polysaccharide biosynthesis protein PelC